MMYRMYGKLVWFLLMRPVLSLNDTPPTDYGDLTTLTPSLSEAFTSLTGIYDLHTNSTCLEDFIRYSWSVDVEEWAAQMYDSMEKTQFGKKYGRYMFMGNFDECISAKSEDFTGKHCMVDMIYGSNKPRMGNYLSYGLCVPSTCTGADIESAIRSTASDYPNVTIQANDKNCWTSDPVVLSTGDWIVIELLCLIGILIVGSTVFDVMFDSDAMASSQHDLLSSFSLYRNIKQLFRVHDGPENVSCLHGIRSLTMFWIILDHEYMLVSQMPVINAVVILRDFVLNKYEIPIINGFLAVDTFLLLSGLLVTLVFFRNVRKTGSYDAPAVAVHRFIRVTPTFAFLILIHSTLLLKIGRGPLWNRVVGSAVESCREVWWTGLVYLENILSPKTRCLIPSWYLSIDMQMFWLAPLLLYPLLLWPRKGLIALFAAILAAVTTNFFVSYIYQLGPHRIFTESDRQLDVDYIQTHMRMTPYVVGMGLGYLLCGIKSKNVIVNLTKTWIVIGWLLSAGLCLGSMYGIIYFMDNDYRGEFIRSSSYLALHRFGWAVGVGWLIFACTAGYGGPVDRLLSWTGFQVFGKISYSMFLVHTLIQICRNGMLRTEFYLHDYYMVSNFFSTLLFSILLSTVLYLFVEAPFINLDRHFLGGIKFLPYPRESGKLLITSPKRETTNPQLTSVVTNSVFDLTRL